MNNTKIMVNNLKRQNKNFSDKNNTTVSFKRSTNNKLKNNGSNKSKDKRLSKINIVKTNHNLALTKITILSKRHPTDHRNYQSI